MRLRLPRRRSPARPLRRALGLALGLLTLSAALPAAPARTPPPGVGIHLGVLRVGPRVYRDVTLLAVNARTVVIAHAGGMASVRLRDLPADLRAKLGYDPQAEAAADQALADAQARAAAAAPLAHARTDSRFEELLQHFGQAPDVRTEVDLRPRFAELELGVKQQGARPSCTVFAVVGALEFENAELTGTPEKFSEEYLIWATRRTLQRAAPPSDDPGVPAEERDEGFSLGQVVTALRAYGIPAQAAMPYSLRERMAAIPDPPDAVVADARAHRRVFVQMVPGRDHATQLANLLQALNAGHPAVLGLHWPAGRALPGGVIGADTTASARAHAVTLVGYRNATGKIEDTVFLFRNSFGPAWGEHGYGTVAYGYLREQLLGAAVLEVLPASPAP